MHTTTDTPTILVTGASRGLGAVMAGQLAARGYRVFAGVRHGEMAGSPGVVPVRLDVTDPTSIAAAVAQLTAHLGDEGLFALVNNAAVLHAGPLELASPAEVDEALRTNIAGPLAVTQACLPLLRAAHGRVVNVGSINGFLPLPHWGLYSATKAALVALSDALRMELAPWNVGVTLLTLGAFATDIRARAHAAWSARALAGAGERYRGAWATNGALVAMLDAGASDPVLVADALVEVLRSERPPARLAVGDGIDDLLALAGQPVEVREAALVELLTAASGAAGAVSERTSPPQAIRDRTRSGASAGTA